MCFIVFQCTSKLGHSKLHYKQRMFCLVLSEWTVCMLWNCGCWSLRKVFPQYTDKSQQLTCSILWKRRCYKKKRKRKRTPYCLPLVYQSQKIQNNMKSTEKSCSDLWSPKQDQRKHWHDDCLVATLSLYSYICRCFPEKVDQNHDWNQNANTLNTRPVLSWITPNAEE